MKERQLAPDCIRGLCILLMVFGHMTHIGTVGLHRRGITGFIYTFHMPLFLLLSGYFFSLARDAKTMALRVVLRIGVPYVFFGILYSIGLVLIAYMGIATTTTSPKTVMDVITRLLVRPEGGYWFLRALLIIQFAVLFVRFVFAYQEQQNTNLIILVAIVVCSVIRGEYSPHSRFIILSYRLGLGAVRSTAAFCSACSTFLGWFPPIGLQHSRFCRYLPSTVCV